MESENSLDAIHPYDIFSLLVDDKIQIFTELYKSPEEYSKSSYFFFFKGMQYEYGLKKKKDLSNALEFYKQGSNINNFLCYYKLFLIYSLSDENEFNKYSNVKSGEKLNQSLYYLLKFFAYLDEDCIISYFTKFLSIESNYFARLKSLFINHQKDFTTYLIKNQYELCLDDREKDYLLINLNYFCDNNIKEYFTKLFELFKNYYFHEESQYIIFCHLIKNNQMDSLENFFLNKISINGNLKIYPFIIKTFLNNLQKSKRENSSINQIINLISTEKKFWTRKLKFSCQYQIYAELKLYEIEVEKLYDEIVDNCFNSKYYEESRSLNENHNKKSQSNSSNSTENFIKKINKLIKYLYRSLVLGNLESIKNLFYLNLFANKNLLPHGEESEEKVRIFIKIFEILDNLFRNKYKRRYLSNDIIIILAIYYLKGIKIKKNFNEAKDILNYLIQERLDSLNLEEKILVNFYLNKCKEKLRIKQENINDNNNPLNMNYSHDCLSKVASEIRTKNKIDPEYTFHSLYHLIKSGLSNHMHQESKNNQHDKGVFGEAVQIVLFLGNYYSNINRATNISTAKISFSIIDKIYLCKILKLLKTRKEFSFRESYLNNLSRFQTFNNISIVSNPSDNCCSCSKNPKEALAVPCGHKFICLECYEVLKDDVYDLEYTCSKCNVRVESVIEKVYK